jgi:hypothetical protein
VKGSAFTSAGGSTALAGCSPNSTDVMVIICCMPIMLMVVLWAIMIPPTLRKSA